MRIEVSVELGLSGCKDSVVIEVADDATDEDIQEEAEEALFNLIEWGWSKEE